MRQGRQGIRTDRDVRQEIERLALEGSRPAEILRTLELDSRYASRRPGIRTVRAIASAAKAPDPSGSWNPLDSDPDDAAAVVAVLADVLESEFRVQSVTSLEAEAIARVARIAPDLPGNATYLVARDLARGAPVDVTGYLALTPWRDGGVRYARAFARRRVTRFATYYGQGEISDEAWAIIGHPRSRSPLRHEPLGADRPKVGPELDPLPQSP
jgi:hypothetical protein